MIMAILVIDILLNICLSSVGGGGGYDSRGPPRDRYGGSSDRQGMSSTLVVG